MCVLFTTKPCSTSTKMRLVIVLFGLGLFVFWYPDFIEIEDPIVVFIMILYRSLKRSVTLVFTSVFTFFIIANHIQNILKKKESNKTKQKKKTVLLKRKKRERVACLYSFYVYTRVDTCNNKHFSFKIFLFTPLPPLKNFSVDPRLPIPHSRGQYPSKTLQRSNI